MPAPGARRRPRRSEPAARREAAIRPERFARLVTLASILIEAGRAGERLRIEDVRDRLQVSDQELQEDVNVLNVVNFGGGSYVLYAEVGDDGWIEVDNEPYSDNFARPARLLPVEAKALVAAIDLIGEHLPEGALTSAREKIVAALGADPMEQGLHVAHAGADDSAVARVVSQAIADRHLIELEYYRPNKDEFSRRTVEPYALVNGREGWYVATFDPRKDDVRHFRLDRIKEVEVLRRPVRASARGRPGRRRRRLAAHRRARVLARGPRLGLAGARPLGARGAHGRRGARGRLDRRRGPVQGHGLARQGGPARGRRRRRPRARGRPRRRRPRGRAAAGRPRRRRLKVPRRFAAWRGTDAWRAEAAELDLRPDGLVATGVQVGDAPVPYRLDYRLDASAGWVTGTLEASATGDGWTRRLRLVHDGRGTWSAEATATGRRRPRARRPAGRRRRRPWPARSTATSASRRSRTSCPCAGSACSTTSRGSRATS